MNEGKEEASVLQQQETSDTRFIPLVDWPKYHPWPPLGGLRWLVFHAKTNNFEKVMCRVGKRILINERKFFEFIHEKNDEGKGVK